MTAPHPETPDDDSLRIVIEIRNASPIELVDRTDSLRALAREHEARLRQDQPGLDVEETRLLVTDVRKGSIIFELVPVLAPIVSTIEMINTVLAFVEYMRGAFERLRNPGARLPDATTTQLKNLGDTVRGIAKDADGSLTIAARHSSGETVQEIVVNRRDAAVVRKNAEAQRREIEERVGETHIKVLMRLHQSSISDVKLGRRTSEKRIVERVSADPKPLIYVSEHAGRRIKAEILDPEGNPYAKAFVVDVDVEKVRGRPQAYRILDLHDVIELGEDPDAAAGA